MDTFAQIRPEIRPTTQAAEGLPRWRWTTDELVRLRGDGVFRDMDRFELIGGEIVPMPADGRRHATLQDRLAERWSRRDPDHFRVGEEKQFNLDATTYTKPDIIVWSTGLDIYDVRGPDSLCVVEIADSSLDYDLDFKRRLYASFGVREYWVIEAETIKTHIHRAPSNGDYTDVAVHPSTATLVPLLAPALSIRLADLAL